MVALFFTATLKFKLVSVMFLSVCDGHFENKFDEDVSRVEPIFRRVQKSVVI